MQTDTILFIIALVLEVLVTFIVVNYEWADSSSDKVERFDPIFKLGENTPLLQNLGETKVTGNFSRTLGNYGQKPYPFCASNISGTQIQGDEVRICMNKGSLGCSEPI